jgi:hypothetical protein
VITDETGNAYIYFYTADRAGRYTVTMEGSDMNGNIGAGSYKIKASP